VRHAIIAPVEFGRVEKIGLVALAFGHAKSDIRSGRDGIVAVKKVNSSVVKQLLWRCLGQSVLAFAVVVMGSSSILAQAVDVNAAKVTLALATEPPTLNSAVASDTIASFLLSHLMEGLLSYGENGELAAGVAQRWQLDADGASFWLRKDARWSDGP
jgi:ABC-type transport system substrate-binding protein